MFLDVKCRLQFGRVPFLKFQVKLAYVQVLSLLEIDYIYQDQPNFIFCHQQLCFGLCQDSNRKQSFILIFFFSGKRCRNAKQMLQDFPQNRITIFCEVLKFQGLYFLHRLLIRILFESYQDLNKIVFQNLLLRTETICCILF